MEHDEMALRQVMALAEVAGQLVGKRDGEVDADTPIRITGHRMAVPGQNRTISTTRIVERLIDGSECRRLLEDGATTTDLTTWLNERVLTEMVREAALGFLDVDGVATASQLHEWVDAQLPDDAD